MTSRHILAALAGAGLLAVATTASVAQEPAALPEICTAGAISGMQPSDMGGGMTMGGAMMGGVDPAHHELSAGMVKMNADMMLAMGAEDIDVAFVCGMIPHHQGAIAMAKAELAHGDDPWAKELAEKVIAAQEREIADMLAWLEQQK